MQLLRHSSENGSLQIASSYLDFEKGAFPALLCDLSTMPRNANAGNASHK
jgi:hypothetical protein